MSEINFECLQHIFILLFNIFKCFYSMRDCHVTDQLGGKLQCQNSFQMVVESVTGSVVLTEVTNVFTSCDFPSAAIQNSCLSLLFI